MKLLMRILFVTVGLILYASAGAQWIQIAQPGENIVIISEDNGYYYKNESVGSHGSKYEIYRTTDCWQTFTMVYSDVENFGQLYISSMMFCNDTVGFIAVWSNFSMNVRRTLNGGYNWTGIISGDPSMTSDLSLYFMNDTFGFLSFRFPSSTSNVYKYENGNTEFVWVSDDFLIRKNHLYMINDSTGFIFCESVTNDFYQIIKSSDSCYNWQCVLDSVPYEMNDLFFVTGLSGFVVAGSGSVFRTVDGGDTWIPVSSGTDEDLNSVCFIDESTGHIVGNNGIFLNTLDGGETWESQNFVNENDLEHIQFVNDTSGFVLDSEGNLYRNRELTSISQQSKKTGLVIFPNPAKDIIFIDIGNKIMDYEIDIYNIEGKHLVHQNNKSQIDISSLGPGMYLVTIRSERGAYIQKLVKYEL